MLKCKLTKQGNFFILQYFAKCKVFWLQSCGECAEMPLVYIERITIYLLNDCDVSGYKAFLGFIFHFQLKTTVYACHYYGNIELYIKILRHIRDLGNTIFAAMVIFVRLWCAIFCTLFFFSINNLLRAHIKYKTHM